MKLIRAYVLPKEKPNNPFGILNDFTWRYHGLDWTKTLNQFSAYDIDDSSLVNPFMCDNSPIEFWDCMDITAKKYLDLYKNIGILWSGGLDSTSLVCAFLKNGINPKNLFVYMTNDSITEYPWMYNHLKKIGINLIFFRWEDFYTFDFSQCDCLTSGNGIGGFWYTDAKYNKISDDLKFVDWKNGLIEQYRRARLNTSSFIPYYEEMMSKVNVNIRTFVEFQKVCTLTMGRICFTFFHDIIKTTKYFNFFEEPIFFRFFLQYVPTYETALKQPYKFPMREYIYSYTKDEDYFKNKGKVNSCKMQKWAEEDTVKYHFPLIVETPTGNKFYNLCYNNAEERENERLRISEMYLK